VDRYPQYEAGLQALMKQVRRGHPRYDEANTYQERLLENIMAARLGNDSEPRRTERAYLLDRLNQIALTTLNISFAELCELNTPVTPDEQEQAGLVPLVVRVVAFCLILAFLVAALAPAVPQPAPAPTPVPTRTPTPTPVLV
jgi:hypothetical protein